MKRRTKNLTSVFCGAVFALALIVGGSVVASELKEVPAAAASHGVKISADDLTIHHLCFLPLLPMPGGFSSRLRAQKVFLLPEKRDLPYG